MPGYCPRGFMCSEDTTQIQICPKNFYCPLGTIFGGAQTCASGLLATCPEGTENISKFGLAAVFIILSAVIFAGFHYKAKADAEQDLKRKRELDHNVIHSLSDQPKLARLSKTFDIEFQNLGLVLPSGVEIMGNVTGSLRSGRCTAIMGPSGYG